LILFAYIYILHNITVIHNILIIQHPIIDAGFLPEVRRLGTTWQNPGHGRGMQLGAKKS
jgi:hypothetical protein